MIFGDAVRPDGLTISITRVISLAEWGQAIEIASGLSAASPWWIGDMLEAADRQYGELAAQAIPEGITPATLRGYQWVSARVPPANRHPGLSWSHHRAVSALPPVEQLALLDQAEAEGWSVLELGYRAKGQVPQETTEKARVFKVEVGAVEGATITLATEDPTDVLEIASRLQAGKRVTIES